MKEKTELIANTAYGKIEGIFENGQYAFKGIPYAASPLGERRWLPPQRHEPWDGIRPAVAFGKVSPQNALPLPVMPSILAMNEAQSEDCLFLNIWTPGMDNARRPVMVWIHGGAFIIGSGSQEMFRTNTLVPTGDVVLVTINYRLGALGFMNLNEVTGGKIPSTGCEGLLDQVAAIEWVRENIRNFGGDPENITVFGESAGAMSIGCLLALPAARGKFGKAILQSGAANTVSSLDQGKSVTEEFLKILDISAESADALRCAPLEQLMAAQEKLTALMARRDGRITPFQPVVDGRVLPEIPIHSIQKGSGAAVHTLIGTNYDEFKLFIGPDPFLAKMDEARLIERLEALIPRVHVPGVVQAYKKGRAARGESTAPGEILTAIQSDLMFRVPALSLASAQEANGRPSYAYLFNWKSPVMDGILGACHALEIGFVFGNHEDSFCGTGPEADALSHKIQSAWAAFARTGSPACETIGDWKPYGQERWTMILDTECRLENAPCEEERSVWDGLDILFTKPI
jgi:para-nitrobenzyl esterase